MSGINIIQINERHLPALVRLEQDTFTETFDGVYTPDDLQHFLNDCKSETALKEQLQHPATLYYMAYHQDEPAGVLKLNMDTPPDTGVSLPGRVMQLEKIYVLQRFQGKKIGKALLQFTYQVAALNSVDTIWLGVWENNVKAQGFYLNEGFEKFGAHHFMVGNARDTDWLLKKNLIPPSI